MTAPEIRDLGLTGQNAGCACCAPAELADSDSVTAAVDAGVVTDYLVDGMTCSHCVRSVTEEVSAVPGVAGVEVDLNAGGASRVRVSSAATLDDARVREAIEEAGYALAATS